MIKQTCKTWQDWELNSHFNSAVHQLNFVFSEIIFFFRPSQTFWFSYCASLLRVNELEFVPLSKYARILKRSISHQFLVIFASIRLSAKATWVPKDICFSWHFIAFNHTGSLINCAATTGHGLIIIPCLLARSSALSSSPKPKQPNPILTSWDHAWYQFCISVGSVTREETIWTG